MPKTRSDPILEALADTLASKTARAEQAGSLPAALALTSLILDFSTTLGQLPAGSRGDSDAFVGMLAQKTIALGAVPLVVPGSRLPLVAQSAALEAGTSVNEEPDEDSFHGNGGVRSAFESLDAPDIPDPDGKLKGAEHSARDRTGRGFRNGTDHALRKGR